MALPTDRLVRRLPRLPFPYSAPTTPGGVEPLPRRPTSGADYDTAWARRPLARVVRAAIVEAVARPAVAALARPAPGERPRRHRRARARSPDARRLRQRGRLPRRR